MEEDVKYIKCEYCGGKATHETYTDSIYVCDAVDCLVEYAMDEGLVNEITDEDHQEYGELIEEGEEEEDEF